MADEQTDTAELAQTVDEQTPRSRVDMVCRFVQRKQFRLFPQGDGDLRAFPFAVAERIPTVMPIKRNVELAAPFIRLEVVGFKELMPVFRRIIRPLKDIDGRTKLMDRSAGRLQFAGGEAEQRGFSATVRADDARPAGHEMRVDVLQQRIQHARISKRNIFKS